jgi:helix-turn-helix protein
VKENDVQSQIARAMFQVYEPIVLVGYTAPELHTVCHRLGLGAHRMSYYAVRAAALGPVSAEVVAALFYHHTVDMVSPAIPLAWSIASPTQIVAARLEAVDGALRRLLPQKIHSAEVAEAAELVREALVGCSTAGRAMFAAHAALPWPPESHLALWHGLNLLREHRGDGHISVVLTARLTPCQAAPLLMAMTGEDRASRSARWPNEVWNHAVAALQERGWLDDCGRPTAEGLAARVRVEDETDALALEPWQHLGAERTQRLWTLLRDLLQLLLDQDGVRLRIPLGLSWPAQWPG